MSSRVGYFLEEFLGVLRNSWESLGVIKDYQIKESLEMFRNPSVFLGIIGISYSNSYL